jgi:hypothetical protein
MARAPLPKHKVDALEIFKVAEASLRLAKERININVDSHFSMPLTEICLVNHALACELFLKCIYAIEIGETTGGRHSYSEIFDQLSQKAQGRITEIYNEEQKNLSETELFFGLHCDLKTAMEKSNNAYNRFRYSFEPQKPEAWAYRLNHVVSATRNYILEIQPDWPLLNGQLYST